MEDFATRRQKVSTLTQKAKWALYRKRDFTDLIGDLTEIITALVDLVPAAEHTQKQLCDAELSEIVGDDSMIRQGMHVASDFEGEVLHEGDRSYLVADSKFGKNVKFVQGNSYGSYQFWRSVTCGGKKLDFNS